MTGYGRASEVKEGKEITVEIKSVNHRFFECAVRAPRNYGYLEEKLKSLVKGRVSRGKIDISVTLTQLEGQGGQVEIDRQMARDYVEALRSLSQPLGLEDDLTLSVLTRLDVFRVTKQEEDEDHIWELVRQTGEKALDSFCQMRQREGEKLKEDLLANAQLIQSLKEQVEQRSPEITKAYRQRLYDRMMEVLGTAGIEEQRILTEAAIFAEKTAVDEETVRLGSHLSQFREILEMDEPVGRKLDFLIQEFNREANTIGSKTQDVQAARLVVEIKSAIEKIREQIQNIE